MTPPPSVSWIGRIVIYRSTDGVDMPGIITRHYVRRGNENYRVALHLFPPPGEGADLLSHEWGVSQAADADQPTPGTWRWPEEAA